MSVLSYTAPLCRIYAVAVQQIICQSNLNKVVINYDDEEIELS